MKRGYEPTSISLSKETIAALGHGCKGPSGYGTLSRRLRHFMAVGTGLIRESGRKIDVPGFERAATTTASLPVGLVIWAERTAERLHTRKARVLGALAHLGVEEEKP